MKYDDASRLISQNIWEDSAPGHSGDKPEKPEKPHTDNGHHYGNDKGDNHIDKKGQQQAEDISSNADDQEAIANNTAELLPPDVYDSGVEAWSGKHDPDQTISYQYDENGNLTEKSGSDIDTFSYQYDNENRLRAVMQNGTVLMAALYDGNGDRIFKLQRHSTSGNVPSSDEEKKDNNGKNVPHGNKKTKELLEEEQTVSAETTETQTLTSSGDIPVDLELLEDVMLLPTGASKTNIESFDLTGYINDINQQYTQVLMEYGKNGKYNSIYSYGLQRLGADYSGAQTVYLYDGRGSMVNETNGSGTSMSAYLYDEWGNLLSGKVHTNGFYSDLFLYNGEATDITTGLQYLRARYYDPGTGRFVQEDTFLGYIQTPLSLNLYIYVQNNPLNYIDPSGRIRIEQARENLQILIAATDALYIKSNPLSYRFINSSYAVAANAYNNKVSELINANEKLLSLLNQYDAFVSPTWKGKVREQFDAALSKQQAISCDLQNLNRNFNLKQDFALQQYNAIPIPELPEAAYLEEYFWRINIQPQEDVYFNINKNTLTIQIYANFIDRVGSSDVSPNNSGRSIREIFMKGIEDNWSGTYSNVFGYTAEVKVYVWENDKGLPVYIEEGPGRAHVSFRDDWSVELPVTVNLYSKEGSGQQRSDLDMGLEAAHEFGHVFGIGDAYGEGDRPSAPGYAGIMKDSRGTDANVSDKDIQMILYSHYQNKYQDFTKYLINERDQRYPSPAFTWRPGDSIV